MTVATLLLAAALTAPPAWRGVWEWSMDHRTPAGLTAMAEGAADLGFDVLMASPPRDQVQHLAEQCHARGVKLYLSTVFAGGEPAWRQQISPEETARRKAKPPTYQQGGEPCTPDEVFDGALPCWSRPEVAEFFAAKVRDLAAQPADGLAFDMVGYENYRRCRCPVCDASLAAWRQAHPEQTAEVAEAAWAEQVMVDFVARMSREARATRPGLGLTIHVYPWFAPHPYYGQRLDVDVVGQTTAWFFAPHWPLEKVRERTAAVVAAQHEAFANAVAAPFLGFYATPPADLQSPERVKAVLTIFTERGASALQVAELGQLVRTPAVAQAVREVLRGG